MLCLVSRGLLSSSILTCEIPLCSGPWMTDKLREDSFGLENHTDCVWLERHQDKYTRGCFKLIFYHTDIPCVMYFMHLYNQWLYCTGAVLN